MKLLKYFSLVLGIAMMPMLAACEDDEEDVYSTPLDSPVVTSTSTFKSIDCTWKAIDGAQKYGYELTDGEGKLIERNVTQDTSASFTGLNASSPYYFSIWAYGAYKSADGTSEVNTFEIRTADLTKLATPVLIITQPSSNQVRINWEAVPDAESYTYVVRYPETGIIFKSGTTESTSLSYNALTTYGTYTVEVTATTTQEGYLDSDTATGTFDAEQPAAPPMPF